MGREGFCVNIPLCANKKILKKEIVMLKKKTTTKSYAIIMCSIFEFWGKLWASIRPFLRKFPV